MVIDNSKIVVGFSGGVDSLVTALLLKNKGYEVYTCTFIFTDYQLKSKFIDHVEEASKEVAQKHSFVDLRSVFKESVERYFKEGYLSGETPNPCTFCNIYVKWPQLFLYADEVGAEKVATGHYAQVSNFWGSKAIQKGVDPEKEQSFFLWGLKEKELLRMILPLGNMQKVWVKKIASEYGFNKFTSQKESVGPCFTSKNYRQTLKKLLYENENPKHGNFLSTNNEVLGRHEGYPFYTVSQRKGLGINKSDKLFVKKIIPEKNQIILAKAEDLWVNEFYIRNYFLHFPEIIENNDIEVKIRYRNQSVFAKVKKVDNRLYIKLQNPEWAVAPGQTAALYYKNYVIGGGFIDVD